MKNFGFWYRYESRTGTHNAYKEFRSLKLTDAVNMLCKHSCREHTPTHAARSHTRRMLCRRHCNTDRGTRARATDQDMAGRSRAKAAAIQILKTAELTAEECKRPIVKQFHVRAARCPASSGTHPRAPRHQPCARSNTRITA